ncbi:hypothetical protein N0V83_009725 [Neocucurbitaria cava]|uniref:non-specific serine/threonine protein kinase n=1 Tax=Neocucurbitaria cava TaxID=798079 RepID=A0A9W9CH66_9PLEO|nr:hypothetical protein N0V83_009725 [Neocucurbitaria cava]
MEPDKQLPEPFLWLIFRGLAEALLVMETGTTIDKDSPANEYGRSDQPSAQEWNPMINVDIKPMNVILGESQRDFYPAYKTAKMIDFGLCHPSNRFTVEATKHETGTPGFWPPEQEFPLRRGYRDVPINVLSEIFNVGMIMLSLMERQVRTLTDEEWRFGQTWEHSFGYHRCYSNALESLVFKCLKFKAEDRPDLWELLYGTMDGRKRWEKAYGSVNKPAAELPDFATVRLKSNDDFLIGAEAPDEWLGMRPRKRRAGEEARLAPTGRPAVNQGVGNPRPLQLPPAPGQGRVNEDAVPRQLQPGEPSIGRRPEKWNTSQLQQPSPTYAAAPVQHPPTGLTDQLPSTYTAPHEKAFGKRINQPNPDLVPLNFPNAPLDSQVPRPVQQPDVPPTNPSDLGVRAMKPKKSPRKVDRKGNLIVKDHGKQKSKPSRVSVKENRKPAAKRKIPFDVSDSSSELSDPPAVLESPPMDRRAKKTRRI